MKTLKIEKLKAQANAVFRDSVDEYATQRRAVQCFVENLLMQHNAYQGFRYLTKQDAAEGRSIGMTPDYETGQHVFHDETRVAFY